MPVDAGVASTPKAAPGFRCVLAKTSPNALPALPQNSARPHVLPAHRLLADDGEEAAACSLAPGHDEWRRILEPVQHIGRQLEDIVVEAVPRQRPSIGDRAGREHRAAIRRLEE